MYGGLSCTITVGLLGNGKYASTDLAPGDKSWCGMECCAKLKPSGTALASFLFPPSDLSRSMPASKVARGRGSRRSTNLIAASTTDVLPGARDAGRTAVCYPPRHGVSAHLGSTIRQYLHHGGQILIVWRLSDRHALRGYIRGSWC